MIVLLVSDGNESEIKDIITEHYYDDIVHVFSSRYLNVLDYSDRVEYIDDTIGILRNCDMLSIIPDDMGVFSNITLSLICMAYDFNKEVDNKLNATIYCNREI